MYTIIYVDSTPSTNSLLSASARHLEHGTVIAARTQTCGRGQRGNSWEADSNQNLTFSVLLKPKTIVASHQFELSQLVSLSVVAVLREQLGSDEVRVKWPNDIYYRDSKICGILIENSLQGVYIDQSVVGIGINVNQAEFVSGAPNPVSMRNISGRSYELDSLLEAFTCRILDDFDAYEQNPNPTTLAAKYRTMMWRNEGFWPYHDNLRGVDMKARVAAVAPTGHLTLSTEDGCFHTYAFKEVAFVL